jgi:hypothetical protein
MLKKLLNFFGVGSRHVAVGKFVGRAFTRDDAFKFRMGAGFAGTINRAGAKVEPCLINASTPPTLFGQPVIVDTNGARPVVTDTAIDGITVRPWPSQQPKTANDFGDTGALGTAQAPPVTGHIDVLRSGYIMVKVVGTPVKGGTVYVWNAATSGAHIQGGFEAVSGSTATITLGKTYFNGGPDANGVVELAFNI